MTAATIITTDNASRAPKSRPMKRRGEASPFLYETIIENSAASQKFLIFSTNESPIYRLTFWTYTDNSSEVYSVPVVRHIHSFPNEPYEVVKPIPVHFRRGQPSGIIATFEDANIAYVGETWIEAFNGLQAEILDTFEDYVENESILGPEPQRQLAVLREFLKYTKEC